MGRARRKASNTDETLDKALEIFDNQLEEFLKTQESLKTKNNDEIKHTFNVALSKMLKSDFKDMKMGDYIAMQYNEEMVQDEIGAHKTLKKSKSRTNTRKTDSKRLSHSRRISSVGSKTNLIGKTPSTKKRGSNNNPINEAYFTPSKKLKTQVITPKIDMRAPILKSSLRAPRFGEVMFSADGSPIFFPSTRETLHETKSVAAATTSKAPATKKKKSSLKQK